MATSHSVWGDCPAHKRNQLPIPGGLVYHGVGIFQSYRLLVRGSGWDGLWIVLGMPDGGRKTTFGARPLIAVHMGHLEFDGEI